MIFQLLLIAVWCSAVLGAANVAHRPPVAASVFPQGSRPGEVVEAELLGEHLDRLIAAHSKALHVEILASEPTRARIRIRSTAATPFGYHTIQFASHRGASNPVLFRIGDLPHVAEAEPNSLPASAQAVPLPATIQGRLNTDGDFDFFRFRAAKGSHWIFDLRAARNGNGLDAALLLYDERGRKLAHSEERFIWDPFLAHTFAQAGEYVIAVQPTHRNNDPNFAYSLDIRQSPHIDTVSPLALRPGENEITLSGFSFQGVEPRLEFSSKAVSGQILTLSGTAAKARVTVAPAAAEGTHELTVVTNHGRSNTARFLVDPAQGVQAHARYRDPHRFPVAAAAGQEMVFEARSQRLGTASDLTLKLIDAKGRTVAQNDDFVFPGTAFYQKDPRIRHRFQSSGEYTLELRNLVDTPSEAMPFQLVMGPPKPTFEPVLETERVSIFPGQIKKVKIAANRLDGHAEALPVVWKGLPETVTAAPAAIEPGKNDVEVELTALAAAKPGESVRVTVEAGAKPAWRSVRVSSGGGEGAAYAVVPHLMIAIAEKPLFSLEAAASSVNIPPGGTATIPVMVTRDPALIEPIEFRIENLPDGVTMIPAKAGPGVSKMELTLQAAADAPRARAPRIAILGVSGGQQQQAPRISVIVD
ncbi:MAG: hypothetical protein FJW30_15845 [Acidobacteria bacterium]|nr:hypothetical protein [Acidobacteriota bacterium]